MVIRKIQVERFSVVSSRSFDGVVARVNQKLGHPEMAAFRKRLSEARTQSEVEMVVNGALGPLGLMEFARLEGGREASKSLRFIVGNPLIMNQMVRVVPDAGSYAPVTILIDERPEGVHLSYDRMASLLAPYGSPEASRVARELDSKVEGLLTEAAQ
jgi:hypothetical protein